MSVNKPAKKKPKPQRETEVRHIRMDKDTSERIEAITQHNGVAYGRIVNLVMRTFVENNGAGFAVPVLTLPPQPDDKE